MIVAEFEDLNSTFDQLDSCLDSLEKKSDDLCAKLHEVLASSKVENIPANTCTEFSELTVQPKQPSDDQMHSDRH